MNDDSNLLPLSVTNTRKIKMSHKERIILFRKIKQFCDNMQWLLTTKEIIWLDSFYPFLSDCERQSYYKDYKTGQINTYFVRITHQHWCSLLERMVLPELREKVKTANIHSMTDFYQTIRQSEPLS